MGNERREFSSGGGGGGGINQTGAEALGDVLEAISKTKRAEGWGKICFKGLAVEKGKVKGRIVVEGSFEAKGYGKSTIPVCHFLRGYLAGVLSTILATRVEILETKCLAKGDDYCEFQVNLTEDS